MYLNKKNIIYLISSEKDYISKFKHQLNVLRRRNGLSKKKYNISKENQKALKLNGRKYLYAPKVLLQDSNLEQYRGDLKSLSFLGLKKQQKLCRDILYLAYRMSTRLNRSTISSKRRRDVILKWVEASTDAKV